jgi:hypothetical protein
MLSDRLSTGSSLASSLVSGLGNIYGNILSSAKPPTNFDPMAMAKTFTDDMGGGSEMAQLAKAILAGALRQAV